MKLSRKEVEIKRILDRCERELVNAGLKPALAKTELSLLNRKYIYRQDRYTISKITGKFV